MSRVMFVSLLLLCTFGAWGQHPRHEKLMVPDVMIYSKPDTAAAFAGGVRGAMDYIHEHIQWPEKAKKRNVNVVVDFIVEVDGTIGQAKAKDYFGRDANVQRYASEAERVVRSMPPWTPARYDDRNVRQQMCLTVPFRIDRHEAYSDTEFLDLFPPIMDDTLHVYFKTGATPGPDNALHGDTLDILFCPQLFDALPQYFEMDERPLAIGRFDIDVRHTALLLRVSGMYEDSRILLLVWDKVQHRVVKQMLLADQWGDAGYMMAVESWLDWENGLTVMSRKAESDFDTENADFSNPSELFLEFVTDSLWQREWRDTDFVITKTLPYDTKHSMATFDNVVLAWHHANCSCPMLVYGMCGPKPQYRGGDEAMHTFLRQHLRWPGQCDVTGCVYVLATIEADGTVGCACALRALGCGTAQEAERLVLSMPKWIPAQLVGQAVRSQVVVPVVFSMS